MGGDEDSKTETKEEATYYLRAAGAQCGAEEVIQTAEECETALQSVGKDHTKVAWKDSHRDLPKGCSYEPGRGSKAPHFNTLLQGLGITGTNQSAPRVHKVDEA